VAAKDLYGNFQIKIAKCKICQVREFTYFASHDLTMNTSMTLLKVRKKM